MSDTATAVFFAVSFIRRPSYICHSIIDPVARPDSSLRHDNIRETITISYTVYIVWPTYIPIWRIKKFLPVEGRGDSNEKFKLTRPVPLLKRASGCVTRATTPKTDDRFLCPSVVVVVLCIRAKWCRDEIRVRENGKYYTCTYIDVPMYDIRAEYMYRLCNAYLYIDLMYYAYYIVCVTPPCK